LARRRAVGALVSVGIETPAGEMAVSKTPRSRVTNLAPVSIEIETPRSWSSGERRDRDTGWRDGCRKTPRSRVTNLAPLSIEIETPAGEMAVSKTPRSIVTDLALVGVGAEKKLVLPSKENSLLSRHPLFILHALTPVHPPRSSLRSGSRSPLGQSSHPPFCAAHPGSCRRHPRPQLGPRLARCSRWIWVQA